MKKLLILFLIIITGQLHAQQHAYILVEPGVYFKNKATAGAGSLNVGARIGKSLFHPGFGINWIFEKKAKPSLNANLLLCDDKATRISPVANIKGGINLYSERVGTIHTKGGLYLAASIGILFPSKAQTKVGLSIGFTQVNYKSTVASITTKSKSDYFTLAATLKI